MDSLPNRWPNLIALANLEAAIGAFLEDVQGAGSERSVRTYGTALRRFAQFLVERAQPRGRRSAKTPTQANSLPGVADISVQDAIDFARWLGDEARRERGRAPSQSTLLTYTSALQSFYAFLHREGLRPDLDLEALRERLRKVRGRREKRLPRVPDDGVVEALCQAARSTPSGNGRQAELVRLRDIALLECLRSSGLRVFEAVSLNREHFDLEERSAIVRGKGAKDRVVFFSAEAVEALRAYWQRRGDEELARHVGRLPAFARHDDASGKKIAPLSAQGVRYAVEQLRRRAGAEWPVTPHRLRAWFATHLLDHDVNLAEVQDLLGHESADTTRIYTKVRARRLQEAHRRAFGAE